jgi:hypothetical protein
MEREPELDAQENLPWERGGAVRRDAEPHRGDLLQWSGDLAFMLAVLSFLLCPLVVVVMPFAVTVRVMAGLDLDRMAAGVMIREGENQTRQAWEKARQVMLLSGLAALCWAILLPCCLGVVLN